MEKNGPVFTNLLQRQNRQKSVMRKAPRCCHCRKYLAEDPKKVGEDEVANLRKCCRCKIATYCSDDCEQKNWTEIHKFHCDALMIDPRPYVVNGILKSDSFSEKEIAAFYLTFLEYASSAQDFDNLREIANFYSYGFVKRGLDDLHILVMVLQIILGEDENAYIFVKQLAYGEARDSKSREKDILRENFVKLENTKLIYEEYSKNQPDLFFLLKQLFWRGLIAIKMNVIEDMKFRLTQYEAFHRKMKKRFWPHPRIINLYTFYILGEEKETFLLKLEFQENQVKNMMLKWHAILPNCDCDYQTEEEYRRKSFLELAVQGLQDYFKNHSYARNYILDFCKSNFPKSYLKGLDKDTKKLFDSLKTVKDPHWKMEMKN